MPLELIADRAGHAVLREYDEVALGHGQVRVRSRFGAVKHGTELRYFRADSPDASDRWDAELRLHRRGEAAAAGFPMALGDMCMGEVTEVGAGVDRFNVGDRVFGHLRVRETHAVDAGRLEHVPQGITPQGLMYADPADCAVGAMQDGPVRLGDRVAVFGLGAIGLMVAQAARLSGARWVAVIDPVRVRRAAAERHGADLALDPTASDVGLEIKTRTGNLGVDVAFETSGSYAALEDSLRATRYRGTVVSTAYYAGSQGLHLAGEWHRNRIQIISSRANSEPLRDYGWDYARIQAESLALLVEGRLKADDLIEPIVPLGQVATALQEINEHPGRSIKLGVDYSL